MEQLQVDLIVHAINAILAEAEARLQPLDDLIDSDYAHSRKNHYITALVYSAFPDGSRIGELQVRKHRYGRGLSLPEFLDGNHLYQLYSSAAKPYRSKEVISRVAEYGWRFKLLEFTLSDACYSLSKLDLVSFSWTNFWKQQG